MDFKCFELGTCKFASDPFGTLLLPFDAIFGGLSIVVFWSLMVGIIWLRTHNPMLTGVIGVAMTSAYLTTLGNAPPPAEWTQAHSVGATLLALSIGISVWHLILKVQQPAQ